ncbi:nucleoside deaminase [Treponema ruminis]|uniref:tRNA(Arg) A34 adenosine deaminase TadA n=1 Tax=Treponema ruminis TaxID=744515 RepID=A0A7W8G8C6_9SPIR|nr:nucleoside deaminase [Treponema ruminis]MBB5225576.1 tRNA(Arg) A34 adenosine deaminase TadA [Treponema ruminis]
MDYMDEALKEAYEGIEKKHGGPFASVIVKDGKIIGRGHNKVLLNHDPTCHGEIEAIRDACKKTGSHDLSGAELYTTAEPCPMCLGAILWANISKVYYGCTIEDTDKIGFRDNKFYKIFSNRQSIAQEFEREKCLKLFEDYEKTNPDRY